MTTESQRRSIFNYDDLELIESFNRNATSRKKALYWLGFLEGTLASGRIEPGEPEAILKEAQTFAEFFGDPDAIDFIEDFQSQCFSSHDDIRDSLIDITSEKYDNLIKNSHINQIDELNRFLGYCSGIICDSRVLPSEATSIRERLRNSPTLMNEPSLVDLRTSLFRALSDEHLSLNEADEVREFIARLVGDGYADTGLANIGNVTYLEELIRDPSEIIFSERTFVLTGPMRCGTRSQIVKMIEQAGGIYQPAPNKSTDYVVVAVSASSMWRATHYGTKIEKARALRAKGINLAFLCESALETALTNFSESP